MSSSGDASGMRSDRSETDASTPAYDRQQQFDIDAFLGAQDRSADDGHQDGSGWRRKVSDPSVWGALGDFAFGVTLGVLKRIGGASLVLFIVVLVVFGPSAPWKQLSWNILRGGADDASTAQCDKLGEWFSLFDRHTDRIHRLMDDAGSPDSWDTVTIAKMTKLLPIYMDDWLAEMRRSQPPPAGKTLNDLYISFLENYEKYVAAIRDGDLKAQTYYERENTIIQDGLDIETRYIMNLCI